MDRFTRAELNELLEYQGEPCISIYLQTQRAGAEIQQNSIRFKNLLKSADEALENYGTSATLRQNLLEQANQNLLLNETFWQHQSEGLAVFAAPDFFRYFRLPYKFDEMVSVSDQFYVKPLFQLFQHEGRFYILALSQDQVRLLEGTKYGVESVSLEDMPTSLAEALKWDDPEKQLQQHSISRGGEQAGRGRPDTTFHGHGVGTDDEKTNLLRYFQKVDKGLQDYLAEERVPLVIAGVEYLIPIYREASSYQHIVDENITGNQEGVRDEDLHVQAWKLLEPIFKKEKEEAVAFYKQQAGMETGRASNQVEEIIQSAYGGRVNQLFIRDGAEVWGRYNRDTNQVEVAQDRSESSEDLLNTAATYTFINNGTVYVMDEENMPESSPVAATFRY